MNGSFGLGWLELQGPENMEWTMHAKQRNPSRIQAQEVAQKGPECDAKVCLTRPSNPLKTLGPEPRLVCYASSNVQTLYRHYYRTLGSASKTAKRHGVPHPTFEPLRNTSTKASATHAKRHPDEEKVNRAVDGK